MKVIVTGLGRMGNQIAHKLADSGFGVIAHNRSPEKIAAITYSAQKAYTKQQAIEAIGQQPVIVWMMIADTAMAQELASWLKLVPAGSIIIDGGNSDFRLSSVRAERVADKGSSYLDVGTSGGVWGYKNGFSLMAGGDQAAYKTIEPLLGALAKPAGAYGYFGRSGAGHFVKMTHNAIEYGMMESLAEGYRLLKEGPYKDIDLAEAAEVWQHGGVISSWLNELALSALTQNPDLSGIDGIVAESGETRWALEVFAQHKLASPAIGAAFEVRLASQAGEVNFATKLLAAMRNRFGGHQINPNQ